MEIRVEPSFFTVLWEQKLVVAGIVLVAAIIGFGLSTFQPDRYVAEATVLITDPNTAQQLTDQMGLERSAARNTATQAEIMESINPSVSTTTERDTGIITVTGESSTGAGAVRTIDTMFSEYSADARLSAESAAGELFAQFDEERITADAEIARLEADILRDPDSPTLRIEQNSAVAQVRFISRNRTVVVNQLETYGNGVQAYDAPTVPGAATGSSPITAALVVAVLGLLVAIGIAWVKGTHN